MISNALFLTGARALVCWKPWGPKTILWCWEIMAWSLLVQIVRGLLFGTWRSFVTLKSNYVRFRRENYKEFLLPSWPGPESNLREVLRRLAQKNYHPEWHALLRLIDQKDPTWKLWISKIHHVFHSKSTRKTDATATIPCRSCLKFPTTWVFAGCSRTVLKSRY